MMIPTRNRKKTLQVTVEEMRNFAFIYVEKYSPSKQQLKTYLLKKYMKLSSSDIRKKDVNSLIDIVLSDLEKNKFINDKFYSDSKAKNMIQRGNSINKIRNYLIGKGINDEFIKDTVNTIKRRQKFRPFAPAILSEFADEYFDGPMNEYMQFVAKAKHDFKSVTHVDGTARVQLVKKNCGSIIRSILEEWFEQTGCPMLLNTSLNIKGKPIVNTWDDAEEFSKKYNVNVF